MTRLACVALTGLLLVLGCDSRKPTASPVEEPAPRELTPRARIGYMQTQLGVLTAIQTASNEALRVVESQSDESAKNPPAELAAAATKKFTLFFGANNQGERNDCGCRTNPLGGLGRRHTMLKALQSEAAKDVWGEAGPAIGPVFHVDAGDAFFATNTANRETPEAQKIAKYDADSVSRAFATFPPDAVCAGEHDLVFGADYLAGLARAGGFPVISANLRDDNNALVFPASVVVDRGGVKVALVGLTKEAVRSKDFYSSRKLVVDDPFEAAKKAIAELPPVDAVVLLSNLGLAETTKLVHRLRSADVRLEMALVSSSNGMTSDPDFIDGVPIMEPMSRGKYMGRVDVWLQGDETRYRNASFASPAALQDYRRAVRSYWTTRIQVMREELKIAELESSLATLKTSQQADVGNAVAELTKRRIGTIDAQKKRLVTIEARRVTTADALMLALHKVTPGDEEPSGDDWVSGRVVPVKIEFDGETSTRKVLDPREKKRPEPKGHPGIKLGGH